jgi:DNA polymerase-3 subunit delta'
MKSILTKTLPWQTTLWQRFFSLQTQKTLPHALLISGNAGLGKRIFAKQIAHSLICENSCAQSPFCEECSSCQLFSSGNHPDYYLLTTDANNRNIKIDMIRDLQNNLAQTATQAGYKIIVLEQADTLQTSSANALLKILEEPPAKTIFILVSDNSLLMLPTIKSRCQELKMSPAFDPQTLTWLEHQGVERATEILELVEGAPLLALNYSHDKQRVEDYEQFYNSFIQLVTTSDIFNAAAFWCKIESDNILTWLAKLIHDMIIFKMSDIETSQLSDELKNLLSNYSLEKLFKQYQLSIELKRVLQRQPNLNLQLQYEAMLAQFN